MRVTRVKFTKRFEGDRPLKAFAAITFDDAMVVKGFKVMELKGELQVLPPSERDRNGRKDKETGKDLWWDIVFFYSKSSPGADLKKDVHDSVLKAFQEEGDPAPQEPDAFADAGDDLPF